MENVLIVSSGETNAALFAEILKDTHCGKISVLYSAAQARWNFCEQDFDLVIIDAPLIDDENGGNLALYISAKDTAQVILTVKNEDFDKVSAIVENYGVLLAAKPIDKTIFYMALKLVESSQRRIKKVQIENEKLKRKIEDIKIIDRAKLVLISNLKMSEFEAHKFIEKQAMDIRSTRVEIAKSILKMYDG
jgi:response regulator NasT